MTSFLLMLALHSTHAVGGSCPCPDDRAKNGSRCGERAAFCRSGGKEPMCGAKTEMERAKLLKEMCPAQYAAIKRVEKAESSQEK